LQSVRVHIMWQGNAAKFVDLTTVWSFIPGRRDRDTELDVTKDDLISNVNFSNKANRSVEAA